jgi:hypothetical protein
MSLGSSDRAPDSIVRCYDRCAPDLLILDGYRPPEVIEWPALVCEVRKENEREAEQRPALHWRSQSLLGHLIDRGQGSIPNLRYAESHAEHE